MHTNNVSLSNKGKINLLAIQGENSRQLTLSSDVRYVDMWSRYLHSTYVSMYISRDTARRRRMNWSPGVWPRRWDILSLRRGKQPHSAHQSVQGTTALLVFLTVTVD
jgi:hypothetical protein